MLTVAVVEVPNLTMLLFKLGFKIYSAGRIEIGRGRWITRSKELLELIQRNGADNLHKLLDILFESYVSSVELRYKKIAIKCFPGFDCQSLVGFVVGAIHTVYSQDNPPKVIKSRRIYIDGINFDIPLGSEIIIGEPKPKPYVAETPLTITI